MSAKIRTVWPGTALITAGAVALGPALAAAPQAAPPPVLPTVQVEAIALTGIGQDIYNAITPVVQYVVGGTSYLINFIPLVGGLAAAQINITYFQGIQPSVAATVDYAAALVHAPLDFFPITAAYAKELAGIGYDVVSAELRFLGFQELPPRPASVAPVPGRLVAAPADSRTPGAPPESGAATTAEPVSPAAGAAKNRRSAAVREESLPATPVVAATDAEPPADEPVKPAAKGEKTPGNDPEKPGRRAHRQGRG